jgi:hypothetical protein
MRSMSTIASIRSIAALWLCAASRAAAHPCSFSSRA